MKKSLPVSLKYPPAIPEIRDWIVLGLDPSLSRTGYAIMHVEKHEAFKVIPDGMPCNHSGCLSHISHACEGCGRMGGITQPPSSTATWLAAGSVKPEKASNPVWIRSKGMAKFIKDTLIHHEDKLVDDLLSIRPTTHRPVGLLICTEFPTPMNDFLVALNRIIHLVFFEDSVLSSFSAIRILSPNASTLRSLMGLVKRGQANKKENILRAYDFIDKTKFPTLDPDSCDGVLLAMMGRYAVSILMGQYDEVPHRFMNTFCSNEQKAKGKGRNMRMITSGILHRNEYFYTYTPDRYVFCSRDASSTQKGLDRKEYTI